MVVSEGAINNIMGGMENTAGVRLHSHRHKLKQRFDIVRKLGQGTYGKVQLAINKETGQEVAIKTIKKAKIETEQDLVRIRREIQIMSSVQHPQIIHIYEVFENREKMVLVMEYAAGGELYDYLSERKVLPELEARRVFRQVASAVYYCHKHKICHRDLKLENILLDLDGNAKIADFGLSNVFDDKQRLDTFCGSPLYASPEIVKGVPYVGPEVDCWSLGVLLYTLVYGAMPFDGSNFRRLVKQITQGDFYEPATPATASELVRHMLTVQSTERANIEDICQNWWVNEGYPESCLVEAEALANQTPVRLDLLLSLAPKHISSEHMLIQPDDEDVSQRSDSERAPPTLKLPPPPTQPEDGEENGVVPMRSHSLGAVPPPGGVSVDSLVKKKEKKKKDSSSKKPPSRPPNEEEKKKGKKEEKEEKSESEGKKKAVKKRDSSSDRERARKREVSGEREREGVKKREVSGEREKSKRDSSSERAKKREASREREKREQEKEREKEEERAREKREGEKEREREKEREEEREREKKVKSVKKKEEESKSLKKRESSLTRKTSTKKKKEDSQEERELAAPSKAPSTDTLVPSSRSPSQTPVAEAPLKAPPKAPTKTASSKAVAPKPEEDKDTETILKETAAQIERTEGLQPDRKVAPSTPVSSPPVSSPQVASPAMSSQTSVQSSQATSPVRSRTGSESSSEAPRPSRSESGSRRASKVFSKAALFDPLLGGPASKSPPPAGDKAKKTTRPGALNMSDLAKKFEEKPSADKKSKVVAPFKVSDARKAFESKSKSASVESPRRKASLAGSSGDSLPTSPTRSAAPPTPAPSATKVPVSVKSAEKAREASPVKKVAKSPSKEVPPPARREKSPRKEEATPGKAVKKGASPSPPPLKDDKGKASKEAPSSKPRPSGAPKASKGDTSDSSDSESEAEKMLRELSEKREKLEMAKKEKMKKVSEGKESTGRARDIAVIREDKPGSGTPSAGAPTPTQQESKEHKFATLPRGFKAKAEPKPRIPFDEPEEGPKSASPVEEDLPSPTSPTKKKAPLKEVIPIPPEQVLSRTPRTPEKEAKDFALSSSSYIPRINSLEESSSGDSLRKKSQVEIVLNPRQPSKPSDAKRASFAEIQISSPISREGSRPEFRTEVQHSVGPPERGAPPEPQLHRARRERIIPIMLEEDPNDVTNGSEASLPQTASRSSLIQPSSSSSSSKAASGPKGMSFGGMAAPLSATKGTSAASDRRKNQATASPESLRKSRRERIIPIAVEGEGLLTPPISESGSAERVRPFQRQSSAQGSFSRGRGFTLDRAESFSSAGEDEEDEEDDGFQILTAESLFSTLLSRVRSLTRKMTNDETSRPGGGIRRTPQPGLGVDAPLSGGASGPSSGFWSSLYSPPRELPGSRRVSETLSRGQSREDDPFGGFSSPLWGRSMSRDPSDAESVFSEPSAAFSTLPRADFLRHPLHMPHHRLLRDPFFSDFTRT